MDDDIKAWDNGIGQVGDDGKREYSVEDIDRLAEENKEEAFRILSANPELSKKWESHFLDGLERRRRRTSRRNQAIASISVPTGMWAAGAILGSIFGQVAISSLLFIAAALTAATLFALNVGRYISEA